MNDVERQAIFKMLLSQQPDPGRSMLDASPMPVVDPTALGGTLDSAPMPMIDPDALGSMIQPAPMPVQRPQQLGPDYRKILQQLLQNPR